jgi:hypothetical protein
VRIHLSGKHALEFKPFHLGGGSVDIRFNAGSGRLVRFLSGQVDEFGRIG